jgi:hypothetical protein
MRIPISILVQHQSPLPVTVRGEVPVTAHTALPVVEQHWPPLDPYSKDALWLAAFGVIVSLVAAWAAIKAAEYAGATLEKVKDQIRLQSDELEVVKKEVDIIARSAILSLTSLELTDSVRCNPNFQITTKGALQVVLFDFSVVTYLHNTGTRAVPEALAFFWLPGNCNPKWTGEWRENPWRDEHQPRQFGDVGYALHSFRVARRIYPRPFRTQQWFHFTYDENRPADRSWEGAPEPLTFYWQLVCDDGTFPDPEKPAPFHIRFG